MADKLSSEELRASFSKDRKETNNQKWSGTFVEYLERLQDDPSIARLAHARMDHDVIRAGGIRDIMDTEDPAIKKLFKERPIKVYPFFQEEFFGIEKTISQIARYFHSAALKGEESRQVLYLMGPVGSGKSSIVDRLKTGLEMSTPFYSISDCPMHEEPLHLLPRHLRPEWEKRLGYKIEGDLCPVCQYKLVEKSGTNYADIQCEETTFSVRNRIGVGVVPPVDPNNQDTSVLIGKEDLSKLATTPEGDPRLLLLNGALNAGNRGLVEFIEVFKNETEYLHAMITATQEKVIPRPGSHGMIYVDEVIVAHSNEAEWQKFKADHTNEAIMDRIVVVKVPYNLRLTEEVKIYEKMLRETDFGAHVAPHTLAVASTFGILSRLEPTERVDLLAKLRLYDGQEVVEKGKVQKMDVNALKEAAPNEGMSGISTRFIMKALDNALSDSDPEKPCINPISVRAALVAMVKEAELPDDVRKKYLEFLQDVVHKDYLERLEREITAAFVYSYREQAEDLFQNYLDHCEAYVTGTKVTDRSTEEELEPDEDLLKSIEEQVAIIGSAVDGFRQEVLAALGARSRRGEKLGYKTYEPLKEAIEKKLMGSVRDISRIVTKARTRDEEQKEKYDDMVKKMLEDGYCSHCVDVVLKYAANNLWKD